MFETLVLALLLTGAYFVGLLIWRVARISHIVVSGTRRSRARIANEIAGLSTEQIRERLLESTYFTHDLRRQRPIEDFLTRVARKDEVALRRDYPRRRLYSMLAKSERAAGRRGRPEAVDHIDELHALLDELSRRAGSA